jgi:dTDP-4-amino-4,6-dideoxygalactose transaminase
VLCRIPNGASRSGDLLRPLNSYKAVVISLATSNRVTKIPFFDLKRQFDPLREEILSELADVCDSQVFILGPKVEALESEIAKLCGADCAIGTSSGTDAELLILMALGIGPGDAVVTTPFTFFATAGCVTRLGARPIFVDIDPKTFNMAPDRLAELFATQCAEDEEGLKTRDGLRIRAVLPVHLFGLACAMDELRDICRKYRVPIIEDAAQAIGAEYCSRSGVEKIGSIGDYGFLSFYPTKNLGAFGDAGIVVTRRADMSRRMKVLRNHGMEPRYYHRLVGGNFRLDALQAAILLKKLPHLHNWSKRRWQIAQQYKRELASLEPTIELPVEPFADRLGSRGHIYHQFVIRTSKRNELRDYLSAAGIGTEIYYPVALHRQECFAELEVSTLPEAERAANEVLALPIFPELTEDEILIVAEAVKRFFRK